MKYTEEGVALGIRAMSTKISYVFGVMLATMILAQLTGLHNIIGAFFAGLMVNKAFS